MVFVIKESKISGLKVMQPIQSLTHFNNIFFFVRTASERSADLFFVSSSRKREKRIHT